MDILILIVASFLILTTLSVSLSVLAVVAKDRPLSEAQRMLVEYNNFNNKKAG